MNEHTSPFRRLGRISLAVEPPFRLGVLQVRPAALEVSSLEGAEMLEPRVMQVLVALARARGEPVGRDEMIDLCWDGRIVSEDALNRCIVKLRKALGADPRVTIETIAKIGYRLRVRDGEARAPAAPVAPVAAVSGDAVARRRPWRWIMVGAALLAAAGAAAAYVLTRPGPARTAQGFRPLTAEPGLETWPALSRGGDVLVYAAGATTHAPRELYMRATRDGEPVRLTTHPLDDFAPAWSPRGDRIAFVRTDGASPCQILTMTVPGGAERLVGRCAADAYTRVSWLDETTLVHADRPAGGGVRRIRALDIETGAIRDLTTPPADFNGDADPLVSPDGRLMAFRRTAAPGIDDLYVRDMKTGRERRLTDDGWKARGFAWTGDRRHLVFSSNRGLDFGLWSVGATRDAAPRRVSVGLLNLGRLSADSQDRLAVEMTAERVNLEAVAPDGSMRALSTSTGLEWDPAVAADGAVAFVSDRSGASELWVAREGTAPVRLTSLASSYLHGPHWSPDGQRIAFIAVSQRRVDVHEIGRDGSGLRRVTQDGRDKAWPVWGADGALRYVERTAAGWRLMRLGADGQARPVLGGEGWRIVRTGPDGRLYGARSGDQRLWMLPDDGGVAGEAIAGLRLTDDSWAVGREGVRYIRDRRSDRPSLWLHPWSSAPRQTAALGGVSWAANITIDPRNDGVVYGRLIQDETDIGLLELSR